MLSSRVSQEIWTENLDNIRVRQISWDLRLRKTVSRHICGSFVPCTVPWGRQRYVPPES